VVDKARQIVRQVDELIASSRAPREVLAGSLSLGIIPTLGPYLLPWLLPRLKRSYPRLQLVVQEDLTRNLLDRLRNYQIDAALLALPLQGDDLEELPLFDEPFWFACPFDHLLAQRAVVSEAQLRDESLLLLADGHCLRGQALAACGRAAEGIDNGLDNFSAVSLETICQLVAAGFGCTLLPALAAQAQVAPAAFSVRPIVGANASRRIGLVWRRGYPKAGELSLLGALVRDEQPPGTRTVLVQETKLRALRH
jgi:LysR family hydrogen peroxide-inducible transcriptional activator